MSPLTNSSGGNDSIEPTPSQIRMVSDLFPIGNQHFALMIDYRNFSFSLTEEQANLQYLKALENEMLKSGIIIFAYVYIPNPDINKAPIVTLSNNLQYTVIVCPWAMESGLLKKTDTVDAKMERDATTLIEHTDINHIVIVSGDADTIPLDVLAHRRGKAVTQISGIKALSARFRELKGMDNVTVRGI